MDYQDRPSMEVVLDQYGQFQRDLFAKLNERFGQRHWAESPNDSPGLDRVDCGDPHFPEAESVAFPNMSFDGTYPAHEWDLVRDVVTEVGKQHGFTAITTVVDEPGRFDLVAEDPRYGGEFQFGMGNNTVLLLITGCHRWDTPPGPAS